MGPALTAEQLGDYRRDGVVVLRGFLSAESVAEVREEIDRYVRDVLGGKPDDARTLEAEGVAIRNLWRLEQHSAYFQQLGQDSGIHALAAQVLVAAPLLKGVETFSKPARIGSAVPPHQDNAYFCQTPPDLFTLWIAIDRVTADNGPVCFLKGSHQQGTLPTRPSGVRGNSIGLAEAPSISERQQLCATLEPGDATIHHCNTIHYSDANRSARPRLALLLVFGAAHTRTDSTLKAAYTAAVTANPP